MDETSEQAVLLALETRNELFDSLNEMLRSENYLKVLMALEPEKDQNQVAEEISVGQSTVSRAVKELLEFQLVEEVDDGYKKTFPVLDHPMIQYFYEKEVLNNE